MCLLMSSIWVCLRFALEVLLGPSYHRVGCLRGSPAAGTLTLSPWLRRCQPVHWLFCLSPAHALEIELPKPCWLPSIIYGRHASVSLHFVSSPAAVLLGEGPTISTLGRIAVPKRL